jgi:geranylgeranyl pyrophosphate synthase
MSEPLFHSDERYSKAENKARRYYQCLLKKVSDGTSLTILSEDFRQWKKGHVPRFPFFSMRMSEPNPDTTRPYLQWLLTTNLLDTYLENSALYIFMRDLGQAPGTPEVEKQISSVAQKWKSSIQKSLHEPLKNGENGLVKVYQKAQEEGLAPSMIWLMEKLKVVSGNIPEGISYEQTMRKLVKIVAGVTMHQMQDLDPNLTPVAKTQILAQAIQLGYYYGLTYPFIDDLLDSKSAITEEERQFCSDLIRVTLETEIVPELKPLDGPHRKLIQFIYSELKEAFHTIKEHQPEENRQEFFHQASIFYQSQEIDRLKTLENTNYTNEDLYLPVILKSAYSRLLARSILGKPQNEGFDERTFYSGLLNQMHDDMADFERDLEEGHVTPYTYYFIHHKDRKDLLNPSELYWAMVCNLIHDVYSDYPKAKEVLLNRAINVHKGIIKKKGIQRYDERMKVFGTHSAHFNHMIREMALKSRNTYFFDKILRQTVEDYFSANKNDQTSFVRTIEEIGKRINKILPIEKEETDRIIGDTLVEGANYSLEAGGKRLRSLLAYSIGVRGYGLKETDIEPLLRCIEYSHTASLIFDDLPSQDNADVRRGRPTLHKQLGDPAAAELTGLYLIMKATEEQTLLDVFEPNTVQKLIRYNSQVIQRMCKGQWMDLQSKNQPLNPAQLEILCFYKTGMAIEASLIMPALLANASQEEMEAIQKFAYHAGIAFQIRDDILDHEGMPEKMGKAAKMDASNHHSTFVTVLGLSEAKIQLYDHYFKAKSALGEIPRDTKFLDQILDYILNRDH